MPKTSFDTVFFNCIFVKCLEMKNNIMIIGIYIPDYISYMLFSKYNRGIICI